MAASNRRHFLAKASAGAAGAAGMNEVFRGRFGPEPPVRTTIAAAGGIPASSLVEIDCIAVI